MTLPRITLSGPKGTGKDELTEAFRRRGFAVVALADPIKVIARDVWGCDPADLWGPSERREKVIPDCWLWVCPRCKDWRGKVGGLAPTPGVLGAFCIACEAGLYSAIPLTIRRLLQYLGTEVGRGIGEQTWVRALERTMAALDKPHDFMVAPWNQRDSQGTFWPAGDTVERTERTLDHYLPRLGTATLRGVVTPDCRFNNEARALPHVVGLRREGVAWGAEHASEVGVDSALFWKTEAIPYLPDPGERVEFYDGLAARLMEEIEDGT